ALRSATKTACRSSNPNPGYTKFCTPSGATLYIPSDYRHQVTKRDLQILSEFNGRNHHALARKYGLTPSSIYKLLKRIQDRKFERDQGKLDLGDGLA
ncbi:Mor transcription activator family protein, partial [Pseudomonas aeruginosa]|uniref:Mor transcription activator family protein n=1 Tax=Pseudomonas aeruginosa TaxID=287 RepID=UPI0024079856